MQGGGKGALASILQIVDKEILSDLENKFLSTNEISVLVHLASRPMSTWYTVTNGGAALDKVRFRTSLEFQRNFANIEQKTARFSMISDDKFILLSFVSVEI